MIGSWWVSLAQELWPRATWNEQIRKLWQERLAGEAKTNPEALAQCIRNVRCARSSERVELAWVLAELGEYKRRQSGEQDSLESRIAAEAKRREEDAALAAEVADEDAARRTALAMLDPEELASLKSQVARSLPLLKMRGPVSGWSAIAVGLVHATGIERGSWSIASPEPSLVPGHSSGTDGWLYTGQPKPHSSSSPPEGPHGTPSAATPEPSEALAAYW